MLKLKINITHFEISSVKHMSQQENRINVVFFKLSANTKFWKGTFYVLTNLWAVLLMILNKVYKLYVSMVYCFSIGQFYLL